MKTKIFFAFSATIILSVAPAVQAVPVASDNADNPQYAPQPNHNWSPINGGFGFNTWTSLADTGGGGTFMEGVGVNNRQVEGNFSFALYAGGGSYDISRALSTAITGAGSFDIITRFDLAGAGPNLVNIRAGNNTASFGSGELLSFGIVNGNQLSVTDGSGFHLLPSGESRGAVWSWDVSFDSTAGTYSLIVTNLGVVNGFSTVVNGSLEANNTSVGSFAVINSSTGGNQNLIFDLPTFSTIPEPSSIMLGAAGVGALRALRRRR